MSEVGYREKCLSAMGIECYRCFTGMGQSFKKIVHHIDGDPSNDDLDNLIPLCGSCHQLWHKNYDDPSEFPDFLRSYPTRRHDRYLLREGRGVLTVCEREILSGEVNATSEELKKIKGDILPAVNDGASHKAGPWFVVLFGFAPRRRGAGSATPPLLLSAAFAADLEVPLSLPVPTYPDGVPSSFGRMHPSLSDCPGMGAGVPRRIDVDTLLTHLILPIRGVLRTVRRFTPAVNGGILSPKKDRVQNRVRTRFGQDVDILEEHFPEVFDILHEGVCDGE